MGTGLTITTEPGQRGGVSWLQAVAMAALLSVLGCSKQQSGGSPDAVGTNATPTVTTGVDNPGAGEADLLMRVRFAGTAALMANTNAAYLTNIAALPETAALGRRIVGRFASLPERLVKRGAGNAERGVNGLDLETNAQHSTSNIQPSTNPLEPMFADLLREGFLLELRGDSNGVSGITLRAKAEPETAVRWNKALADAAKGWFGGELTASAGAWSAGEGRMQVLTSNHVVAFQLSSTPGPRLSAFDFRPIEGANMLAVGMRSHLLPSPIQRSVYGGFEWFRFTVTPEKQTLSVHGKATYAQVLPELGPPPLVPTNLVTEPPISFTVVRNPGAWLPPESPLRPLLPSPMPEVAYFWGGHSTPYQFFIAVPINSEADFLTTFGPALVQNLTPVAEACFSGPVALDTNSSSVRWHGIPFIAPQISLAKSDTNSFLVGQLFPGDPGGPSLSPPIIERISGVRNQLLFDWEFTQARLETWFRVGQLAIAISYYQQIGSETPSWNWMLAAQHALPNGGNMYTEITQTGPDEITLTRRSPTAFSSIELFWLANWLESTNFPSANFLMPAPRWE